jgi:sugar lactone lactonase YvrE
VKFAPSGRFLANVGVHRFDEDAGPEGVAVDARGNVYVGAGAVMKFSSTGRLLSEWKTYGSHHVLLSAAFGVAVDQQRNVYVVDQLHGAIVKLSPEGRTLSVWR